MKTYREAWKKAGHPGEGEVYLRVPVYVADTDEKAREEPRESIMHLLRYIGDRLAASAFTSGTRAIENRAERGAKMLNIDYEEVLRERMIVGTPGRVIDRLEQLRGELGLNGILAELNPGSLIPHARVLRGAAAALPGGHAALQVSPGSATTAEITPPPVARSRPMSSLHLRRPTP